MPSSKKKVTFEEVKSKEEKRKEMTESNESGSFVKVGEEDGDEEASSQNHTISNALEGGADEGYPDILSSKVIPNYFHPDNFRHLQGIRNSISSSANNTESSNDIATDLSRFTFGPYNSCPSTTVSESLTSGSSKKDLKKKGLSAFAEPFDPRNSGYSDQNLSQKKDSRNPPLHRELQSMSSPATSEVLAAARSSSQSPSSRNTNAHLSSVDGNLGTPTNLATQFHYDIHIARPPIYGDTGIAILGMARNFRLASRNYGPSARAVPNVLDGRNHSVPAPNQLPFGNPQTQDHSNVHRSRAGTRQDQQISPDGLPSTQAQPSRPSDQFWQRRHRR